MIYGYARISTNKQNIERQVRNILKGYPDAKIIKEIFTGTKFQGRRELENKILRRIQPGDTIVFDSVSRMSRNADEGFQLYEDLFCKGVHLVFLKEPHINTAVYRQAIESQIQIHIDTGDASTNELINTVINALNKYALELAKKQIKLAFDQAEKEVLDLHQRTSEGMLTAKLNGKQIGRETGKKYVSQKSIRAKEIILKYAKNYGGSMTNAELIKLCGISMVTLLKYKQELKEEIMENSFEKIKQKYT